MTSGTSADQVDMLVDTQVEAQVDIELERVVRRWCELPVAHALRASGAVREVVDALARGRDGAVAAVPDLGPAVLADQLRVVVHDARRDHSVTPDALVSLLSGLRRRIG